MIIRKVGQQKNFINKFFHEKIELALWTDIVNNSVFFSGFATKTVKMVIDSSQT